MIQGGKDEDWSLPISPLKFDTIWILESIPNDQNQTGTALYENLMDFHHNRPSLKIQLLQVPDKMSLYAALMTIQGRLEKNGEIPILHFEAHGDKKGLLLKTPQKSDNEVDFADLFGHIRHINYLSRHNLFISVSACEGAHLVSILFDHLSSWAPFWGISGSTVPLESNVLLNGYTAFYKELIDSLSLTRACSAFRTTTEKYGKDFHVINAEHLFMLAFRDMLTKLDDPKVNERHAQDLVARAKIEHPALIEHYGSNGFQKFAKRIMSQRAARKALFEDYKRRFFYHFEYPDDIKGLPNPSFEDVLRGM